jgi:hypothetical protein
VELQLQPNHDTIIVPVHTTGGASTSTANFVLRGKTRLKSNLRRLRRDDIRKRI